MLNHEESVHTENVPLLEDFKCKLCSKVFSTKDSLLNHEESVHTENFPLLKDSKCKLSKETEVDQNPSECPKNDSNQIEAESIHEGFKCVTCDILYGDKKDLNEHRARSHKMVMLSNCGICNAGFFHDLLEHVSSCHEGKGAIDNEHEENDLTHQNDVSLSKETEFDLSKETDNDLSQHYRILLATHCLLWTYHYSTYIVLHSSSSI